MSQTAGGPGRVASRRRSAHVLIAALLGLGAAACPAAAQSPGGAEAQDKPSPKPTATPTPARAPKPAPRPATGGPPSGPGPRISRVRCRTACTGPTSARPGSTLDVRGRGIAAVESVVFLGAAGESDDVSVAPRTVTRKRVLVRVPRFARTGPIAVVDANGAESPATRAPITVGAAAPAAAPEGSPGISVEVQSPKVFFDARRKAVLSYVVSDSEPVTVDVDLVRVADGASVARWTPGTVQPGTPRTVSWDGTVGGQVAPAGRYEFRVTARDGSGAQATTSQAAPGSAGRADPDAFEFLDHQFPVRGAHDYGEHVASFGGGRGHKGQDVFARCGTPLVAARGGRVKFKQYHSAAGNYIVIDGERTGEDYAYMHLREAALVDAGDRVRTGQLIGYVGDTGRATGCHLHFELWSAPGWYDGGSPFDPLPRLRQWDATS